MGTTARQPYYDYKTTVSRAFDEAAARYDRMGVEFFTPMAGRLVELAAPAPGERVLDVGCGRGAVTLPAARRVGPDGCVLGIDVAPAMVEQTRAEAAAQGVGNVTLTVLDGERPDLPAGSYDLITGGYSVIFFPDAAGALARYHDLLVPGGRLALTSPVFREGTFPFLPPAFTPLIPADVLEHLPEQWRPEAIARRFNSWLEDPEDTRAVLHGAGFGAVRVLDEPVRLRARSGTAWVDWSHTQGMRLLWQHLPEAAAARLRERLIDGLDRMRTGGGPLEIDVPVRFVTAVRPPV